MIVVGIDGSPASDAALRWALSEAQLRGSKLQLVHAFELPQNLLDEVALGAPAMAAPPVSGEEADRIRAAVRADARGIVEGALTRMGSEAVGGLEIERQTVEGPAAESLIGAARDAELLVVGSRGRGALARLLLGSVSHRCAQNAPCPVVILPAPEEAEAAGG